MSWKPVILESPYRGDIERNLTYARRAMADCISRGEAPFASHLLYPHPDVLDDSDPVERRLGIMFGYLWGRTAQKAVFYTDLGWSAGMLEAVEHYGTLRLPLEARALDGKPNDAPIRELLARLAAEEGDLQ